MLALPIQESRRFCVVLADPPNARANPYATAFPNLGLLYLAAYLRQHLPQVEVHYLNGLCTTAEHVDRVEALAPNIYGLSLASPFAELGYQLLSEIRCRMPSLPIVSGGPHPTAAPREVLARSPVDLCCLGEGEQTFLEVVSALRTSRPLRDIPGTAFRDSEGQMHLAPPRPLIRNLDDIPFPAWDLIRWADFSGCRKAKGKPSIAMTASRGCPLHCVFCSNPVWRREKPWLRLRSPSNIAAEVQLLYDRGVREIFILSDEMNPNLAWAVAVFNAVAELNLKDLHLQCQLRAKPMTSELAAAMHRAGCWLCYIGVESSSQRVLDGIGKHVTVANVESAAQTLKTFGIKVYAFIMMYQVWETGGHLQVESTKEVLQTLQFVLRMRLKGLIDFMSCGLTTAYPGADLYTIANRHDLERPRRQLPQVLTPQDITLRLPGISQRQMLLARTLGLMTQALLFLSAPESYRPVTLRQNLRQAGYKLRYLLGLG